MFENKLLQVDIFYSSIHYPSQYIYTMHIAVAYYIYNSTCYAKIQISFATFCYRCYISQNYGSHTCSAHKSLKIMDFFIQQNGCTKSPPMFYQTITKAYKLMNHMLILIPLCFLLYRSWSSNCLAAPRFNNIFLTLQNTIYACSIILYSTKSHLHKFGVQYIVSPWQQLQK